MEPYALGCREALTKLGAEVPGDVWMQRMMQREGRSPQHIQGMLESHYAQGGQRTLPKPAGGVGTQTFRGLPGEAAQQAELGKIIEQHAAKQQAGAMAQTAAKSPWYRRLGKALRFVR